MDNPTAALRGGASHSPKDSTASAVEGSEARISGPAADEAELKRRRFAELRRQINAGTLSPDQQARIVAEAADVQRSYFRQAQARAEAAQLAEREREHRPAYGRSYKPTWRTEDGTTFDPGSPPKSHAREGQGPLAKPSQRPTGVSPEPTLSASLQNASDGALDHQTQNFAKKRQKHSRKRPHYRQRAWKPSKRVAERVLRFGKERLWSEERSQRLATRCKRNDAIIAHPSSAEAAYRKLSEWSQAAVKRCFRGEGWTFADEHARRHVAWWAFQEEMAVPRAWSRARRFQMKSGLTRFCGFPKFAMCVVGWTQPAIALSMSGAAYSCGGADPIDDKTVQRHTALAQKYGGVHLVSRNPDGIRGLPTETNPRGWSINEYWIPAPHFAPKPGFSASTTVVSFGIDGTPTDLAEMLALELQPRPKWRRRKLLEQQQAAAPPPL